MTTLDGPTLRPSADEWKDPIEYFRKLEPLLGEYGAVKIIPPSSWRPPFAIDADEVRLRTTVQRTGELMERDLARTKFLAALRESLEGKGQPLVKMPVIGGKELDVYKLYTVVCGLGGYHHVTQQKGWLQVAQALKLREGAHCAYALRQQYAKLLLQYERQHHVPTAATGAPSAAPPPPLPDDEPFVRRAVSTLSVALILQDLEERIPWGAVRDSDGCDWALVRPAWIEAISDGPSLQTLAAAVATLEGVLDEKAFDAKWAGKGRDGWLRRLVEATEAAEVLSLVQELEKALRWDDLEDLDSDEEEGEGEGEGEEAAGEEEEPANDGRRGAAKAADKAIKRGPGRPPKRGAPGCLTP